jgi:hypothetical protein
MVSDPDMLDEVSMAAGIALSRWFGQEAKRVFAMLAESDQERENRELVELVERLGGKVTANQLRRHTRKYGSPDEAEAALQALVNDHKGDWKPNSTSNQGGRPTSVFVLRGVVKTPPSHEGNGGFGYGDTQNKSDKWEEV